MSDALAADDRVEVYSRISGDWEPAVVWDTPSGGIVTVRFLDGNGNPFGGPVRKYATDVRRRSE